MHPAFLFALFLCVWLLVIVIDDFRLRRVRNGMVILGMLGAVLAIEFGPQPFWIDFSGAAKGALMAFGVLLPFYVLKWMGAGDVKFGVVIGLWFGLSSNLLLVWLGGSLLAGLHSLIIFVLRSRANNLIVFSLLRNYKLINDWFPGSVTRSPSGGEAFRRRFIPYAGYMAIVAVLLIFKIGPSMA